MKPGTNIPTAENDLPRRTGATDAMKRVQLFSSGSVLAGIFESEIAAVADWKSTTPLPHAPPAILGVTSVQGRMVTVLNVSILLGGSDQLSPKKILSLAGEEQLAVAVDELGEVRDVRNAELRSVNDASPLVLGTFDHNGQSCTILEPRQLFLTAIQGRDRRRRRF